MTCSVPAGREQEDGSRADSSADPGQQGRPREGEAGGGPQAGQGQAGGPRGGRGQPAHQVTLEVGSKFSAVTLLSLDAGSPAGQGGGEPEGGA